MKTKAVFAAVLMLGLGACSNRDAGADGASGQTGSGQAGATSAPIALSIRSANGTHAFTVEPAKSEAEQERGLMYRTDLKPDGGMLFWPYPVGGGAAKPANFWMKNTPSSLDILYIRADGTIARIAENTVPFSEVPIPSGEPVTAVLELVGGRSAELGIAEGDVVSWDKGAK